MTEKETLKLVAYTSWMTLLVGFWMGGATYKVTPDNFGIILILLALVFVIWSILMKKERGERK